MTGKKEKKPFVPPPDIPKLNTFFERDKAIEVLAGKYLITDSLMNLHRALKRFYNPSSSLEVVQKAYLEIEKQTKTIDAKYYGESNEEEKKTEEASETTDSSEANPS